MNAVEEKIYNFVADYPYVRIPLAFFYQLINSFSSETNFCSLDYSEYENCFFGFHDKIPWIDENTIICHRYDPKNLVESSSDINIVAIDTKQGTITDIAQSSAWNWQQGSSICTLKHKEMFVFNDIADGRPKIRIMSKDGHSIRTIEGHISNCTRDGKYGFSISFARLGKFMNGYGFSKSKWTAAEFENRDLTLVDLDNGEKRKLFSLSDFKSIFSLTAGDVDFFSHCLPSPDGTKLLFFYRWQTTSLRLETRLICTDLQSGEYTVLPFVDASHISWRSNDVVFMFGKRKQNGYGFYFYSLSEGVYSKRTEFDCFTDGHPQFTVLGDKMVFDSYPDKKRMQSLYVYDEQNRKISRLARLKIPFKFRLANRCDFHPRFNYSGDKICFDSAHRGRRCLYVADLKC